MDHIVERTLWYDTGNGPVRLTEQELLGRTEPLLILGEAGMGKTSLLEWLAKHPGYARCTARQLINRHNPQTLLGNCEALVIDALDEVSARKEGDAVDLVLGKLGELDYPRFVLSCRVADWQSATGREAIREQYAIEPLELHLDPFDDDDAINFLRATLSDETARNVVEHFNERGLAGLLGNPQTLELISRVATQESLPETRGDLLERAIEALRVEHKDAKAGLQLAKESALNGAGAAFASLILTGSESIVRTAAANSAEGELQLEEVRRLPDGEFIAPILDSRLFRATGADRFTYWHRRIGEFVGARWLISQADTRRKRRRLLSLFHSYGLVPASLRGIHAWLACDPELAPEIIKADPMGIIEYGDVNSLTVAQVRLLLEALEQLATANPQFLTWDRSPVRGIARVELQDDLRRLITASTTPAGLRVLLLEATQGSAVAPYLADDLRRIVLDRNAPFAGRSAASESLAEFALGEDWTAIVTTLHGYGDTLSVRLAIEVITTVGDAQFPDDLIVDLAGSYAAQENPTLGVLHGLETSLSISRLPGILDRLAEIAQSLGSQYERPGNESLTDFAYALIARVVTSRPVTAEQLWTWLEPFNESIGYNNESRRQLDDAIRSNSSLREAIQSNVLLDRNGDENIYQRVYALRQRSPALVPTTADVIALLRALDPADRSDERWREVVTLVPHDGEGGADVRAAAAPFCSHRPDVTEWLNGLAAPRVPKWQARQEQQTRKARARTAARHAEHRKLFASQLERVRAGDAKTLITPASAYLNLFSDLRGTSRPQERLSEWLGSDIADAVLEGFEAFLLGTDPPTARQIAESLAQSMRWEPARVIVAALAERHLTGRGFDDVSSDRLSAGLFELRYSGIEREAGIQGLEDALSAAVDDRGIWDEAMRLYHEPQLEARLEHVSGLYALMRDDTHRALGVRLAIEWLGRFPSLPAVVERELIDRLISAGDLEELRRIAADRTGLPDVERRRDWDAVGFLVDFERTMQRVAASDVEPELLWHIRNRSNARSEGGTELALSIDQLEWVATTFRARWPATAFPTGGSTGDTNAWDAAEFLLRIMRRLGNDPSDHALAAIQRLCDGPVDGYTESLKTIAAEQARIRVEATYVPPSLDVIETIARDQVPVTAEDLQAAMCEELEVVQAKVKSDDAESWRGFFDDQGVPYDEERCRDHLLGLLRQGSNGITLEPEVHVAGDKEVDIACSVGTVRMPIEIKGQWHRELWRAADHQLDPLYARDWRAEGRGIYLVLWFGDVQQSNKSLTSRGRGTLPPRTPQELHDLLSAESRAVGDGRVVVFVLDLSRS
jgi:hypothetical protein